VIGWVLRRWQRKYPGPALAIGLALLVAGVVALVAWILRDLSRGQILRPSIAVVVLAALSLRVIVSFQPRRR
jgi:cobalamin biosynthesis protein CobD/CbiB